MSTQPASAAALPDAAAAPAPRRGRPLALRLAANVTTLVAVVLLVAGLAVTFALRGFLVDRVDQQLVQIADIAPQVLFEPVPRPDDDEPKDTASLRPRDGTLATPDAVAIALSSSGQLLARATGPGSEDDRAEPAALAAAAPGLPTSTPVDLTLGGEPYRVLVRSESEASFVVALPLDRVQETVARLALAEVLVGMGALLLVALGSVLVVRRGLRPLGRIAAEARGLARTDLSHPRAGERDSVAVALRDDGDPAEVADLGDALEAMLGHIDASLTARDEAEERLRRFVADASHELRTPLQSIRGYAELSRRGMVDPEQAATAAGRIEDEAIRMGRLVDDLLLLARLDQGRPLAADPVDLGELAADTVADALVAHPEFPVTLDVPGSPVMVTGDADRLRQVLVNLVTNARVHTPSGTPVRVTVRDDGGGGRVTVTDGGPGIPAADRARVFERFYRVDAGRSRDRGGSGLGLALVQSIVTALGGTVGLESGPDGTSVSLWVPSAPRR